MLRRLLAFGVGAAAGAGITTAVRAAALVAGLDDDIRLWSLAAGLVLAAGAMLGSARYGLDSASMRVGALVAGGVLAMGWVPSMDGPIPRVAAAVGGLVLALGGPAVLRARRFRGDPLLWGAVGLSLVALVLIRIVIDGGALGHDEAALALKARSWLEGTPDSGWGIHRGVGASVLAVPVVLVTESPVALRSLAVAGSLLTVAAVSQLGRVVASHRVGLMAAAVFAIGPSFLRRGAEFLTDVPSTGLLVGATALLWRWLDDGEAGDSSLYAAVVLAVAAVYLRYQSVLSIGLVAATAFFLFRPRFGGAGGATTRALFVGALVSAPYLVWSTATTGAPWEPLVAAAGAGGREFLGEGLVDYATTFPYWLAGPLGAGAIVVAVTWMAAQLGYRRRKDRERRRLALFLVVPALAQFMVLGTISHGEPRFVLFPVALLVVAAAVAIDDALRAAGADLRWAFSVTLVLALVVALAEGGDRSDRAAEYRAEGIRPIVEASEIAAAEADRCAVMTGYLPQVTWTTGCVSFPYDPESVEIPEPVRSGGAMLLFERGVRQPGGRLLAGYLEEAGTSPLRVAGPSHGAGDGRVYIFATGQPTTTRPVRPRSTARPAPDDRETWVQASHISSDQRMSSSTTTLPGSMAETTVSK